MQRHLERSANRPILVQRVNLWWYALALVVLFGLAWLAASNLIPSLVLPLILFACIFWVISFVMAVIARLSTPKITKSAPEPRQ